MLSVSFFIWLYCSTCELFCSNLHLRKGRRACGLHPRTWTDEVGWFSYNFSRSWQKNFACGPAKCIKGLKSSISSAFFCLQAGSQNYWRFKRRIFISGVPNWTNHSLLQRIINYWSQWSHKKTISFLLSAIIDISVNVCSRFNFLNGLIRK